MKFSIKAKQGYTLVEVIMVLIIISVVTSIALPSIDNFHSGERCKSEASILVSYIRQAKYQALQDNTLNRIIFNDDASSFKVQKYEVDSDYDIDEVITTDASNSAFESYDDENWASIADLEEIDFNPVIEIESELLNNNITTIYFKPDGYIYYYNKTESKINILPEKRIIFKYGNSALAVDINSLGVISSESYKDEDEDTIFFGDEET